MNEFREFWLTRDCWGGNVHFWMHRPRFLRQTSSYRGTGGWAALFILAPDKLKRYFGIRLEPGEIARVTVRMHLLEVDKLAAKRRKK